MDLNLLMSASQQSLNNSSINSRHEFTTMACEPNFENLSTEGHNEFTHIRNSAKRTSPNFAIYNIVVDREGFEPDYRLVSMRVISVELSVSL